MDFPPTPANGFFATIFQKRYYLWFCLLSMLATSDFVDSKPKILIIGDSISIGYYPFVKTALASEAVVKHNPGNAQDTALGKERINNWLGHRNWDVIHFNWGLWDLCYRNGTPKNKLKQDKVLGEIAVDPVAYERNLDSLVQILKSTGAELVFMTTTYVPPGEKGRYAGDELKYNAIAKSVMLRNNVFINDLHQYSVLIHERHGKGVSDVHFLEGGSELLANRVILAIKKALKRRYPDKNSSKRRDQLG